MLIGIIGRAGNGKSTLANAINQHAAQQGLAARIYEVSHLILRYCQRAGLIEQGKERKDCAPQDIQTLIHVGEAKRLEDPNFWLDSIAQQIKLDAADVAIIPNVRAENEAEFVQKQDGVVLKVVSTNPDGTPYISVDRDPNHHFETISETLRPDYVIQTPRGAEALAKAYATALFDYLYFQDATKGAAA